MVRDGTVSMAQWRKWIITFRVAEPFRSISALIDGDVTGGLGHLLCGTLPPRNDTGHHSLNARDGWMDVIGCQGGQGETSSSLPPSLLP